jgi:hypothetical protein
MAAKKTAKKSRKKTTGEKSKTGRKPKSGASAASTYTCPNPGTALNLEATVRKIVDDPAFAALIHDQLFKANGGDQEAIDCVASYYSGPTDDELDRLGITDPEERAQLQDRCTEHNRFIDVAAYAYGAM